MANIVQKTGSEPQGPESVDRTGLLVVGMHRSGTSALTKTINLLGADLPRNLMPAHAEFNAAGYWESQDVVDLNEQLLMKIGSFWDDVLPVDPANIPSETLGEFSHRAKVILDRDFKQCRWFVLKDPRIGRLLRLWIPAVRAHGATPKVIIPIRHPLEVAASLQRREGFPEGKSLYLWLRHMVGAIRDSRNVPRAIVLYDELMQDWRTAVERLGRDIDLVWPRSLDEVAPSIEKFLDKKLRHHSIESGHYQSSGLIDSLASDLYRALCSRANDLESLVESIHEQLAPIEVVFTPLLQDSSRRIGNAAAERERYAGELARLGGEFDAKCRHVEQLQQLVASEREVYLRLDTEFKAKVLHLQLVQDQLAKAESDFVKLDREFEVKCLHIKQLEQLVTSEREAYLHLEEDLKARTHHNTLLTEEVASLAEQKNSLEHAVREVAEKLRAAALLRSFS